MSDDEGKRPAVEGDAPTEGATDEGASATTAPEAADGPPPPDEVSAPEGRAPAPEVPAPTDEEVSDAAPSGGVSEPAPSDPVDAEALPVAEAPSDDGSSAPKGAPAEAGSAESAPADEPTADDAADQPAVEGAEGAEGAEEQAADATTTATDGTPVEVTPRPRVRVQIAGMTDVGNIREHNEDNLLVANLTTRERDGSLFDASVEVGDEGLLLSVCDGMGGALAGEIASQMAVDVVYGIVQDGPRSDDEDGFAQKLVAAVQEAGARIYLAAKTNRNQHGMGTTATVAGVHGGKVYVGQVGDSRAYLMRRGHLRQITKDQSLVSKLIEAGQLTEDEAESYEHAHIILQALGTSDAVCVDLSYVDLCRGDVLMLCSDGLSGLATNEQIREILGSDASVSECAQQLIDAANEAGGHDNITVVVARFDGALPEATDEDGLPGYQAHVLTRPVESLVGGSASTSLKIPDLPPPGSDLKNRASFPPDAPPLPKYDDEDDDEPPARASSRASRADDGGLSLPMRSSPWSSLVIGAIVIGVLLGAWLALRGPGEAPPSPSPSPPSAPADARGSAAPETRIDPAHAVDPTTLPAPDWGDAGASDAP